MRYVPSLGPDKGSRIALSPWSRQQMDPRARAILEARCDALGVYVSTVRRRDRSWMVRVDGGGQYRTSLVGAGPLDAVIAGALDDHETGRAA